MRGLGEAPSSCLLLDGALLCQDSEPGRAVSLVDERLGSGPSMGADGRKYGGVWRGGKKHGAGLETYVNGSRYDGQWSHSHRHGLGHHSWVNGSVYLGCWHKGRKHGFGKYTFNSGEIYDGTWHEDRRHGLGRSMSCGTSGCIFCDPFFSVE
jgi:hypothetical protein